MYFRAVLSVLFHAVNVSMVLAIVSFGASVNEKGKQLFF